MQRGGGESKEHLVIDFGGLFWVKLCESVDCRLKPFSTMTGHMSLLCYFNIHLEHYESIFYRTNNMADNEQQ